MANPFDPLNQLQGTTFGQGYNALYGAYNNGNGYNIGNNGLNVQAVTNTYGMGTNTGQVNTNQNAYGNYLLPYLSNYNQQTASTTNQDNAPTYDATKANQDIFGLAKNGMNVRYEMANNQFYVTDPTTGFKFNVIDGKASNVQGTVDPSKAWTAQYSSPALGMDASSDGGFSGGQTTQQAPQITGYTLNAPYQSLQDLLAQLCSDYKFVAPKIVQPRQPAGHEGPVQDSTGLRYSGGESFGGHGGGGFHGTQ